MAEALFFDNASAVFVRLRLNKIAPCFISKAPALYQQPQITKKIQTQIFSTYRFDHNKTNSNIGNTGGTNSGLQHLVRLVSQMGKSPYVARVCWHLVRLFSATHLPCVKGKGVLAELISNKTPLTVSKGYLVLYL